MSPGQLGRNRLSRLPLRVRLVAGFSAAMLVVLSAAGGFVYWRVLIALDARLDADLVATASALAPLVTPAGRLSQDPSTFLAPSEGYQVLDASGRVLRYDPALGATPLLAPSTTETALVEPVYLDVGDVLPASARPLRLYAEALPADQSGPAAVLVVAVRRDQRDEALRELLGQLLAAGLGALVVTAVVGDRLARASLRPVERYRAQAADIAAGATGVRLEVPPARDDEITRLGHTLNDVLTALETALDHERRFVNDASHELRTPLTLLRTRVQLALRRPRTATEYEAVLAEVDTDVDRLARLADQLLAVGGTHHGQAADDMGADLAEVALSVVERRRTLAPLGSPYAEAGVLRVEASGPLPVAPGAFALEQVLSNLLDNAALHGRPPVTVAVGRADAVARLTVTDAGDGMDRDTLATAPQRFARATEARARPGAGLGLSLVAGTVEEVGGELRLCSRGHHESFGKPLPAPCTHGEQTTVTVLLPVA